jgi:hypothetical protein
MHVVIAAKLDRNCEIVSKYWQAEKGSYERQREREMEVK